MPKLAFLGRTDDGDRIFAEIQIEPAQRVAPYETIEHKPMPNDAVEVSVVQWTIYKHCHTPGSIGGQGEVIRQVTRPAKGWTLKEIRRLADLADHWHLNGLKAGCAHQPKDSPIGTACPETGYRYGHAWLFEPIPQTDLNELRAYAARTSDYHFD